MSTAHCDVAIIGAGPYGLATAAHLRAAGVETRIFGEPMEFWAQMPAGTLLRSKWEASSIAAPRNSLKLDHYQQARGQKIATPIPLEDFIAYGRWFQQQAAPHLDRRRVAQVAPIDRGMQLTLTDGESLSARRVVVATGIAPFVYTPPQFAGMPLELVSHPARHADFSAFNGRKVLVIGGGQYALESAALLHESGADVEVLVRAARINWLSGGRLRKYLGPLSRFVYAWTDVGPPGLDWLVAFPGLFRRLPRSWQTVLARRAIRPAGSTWVRQRLRDVTITTGRAVVSAERSGAQLRLKLDDYSERLVDHVLMATGYRIDVAKYRFLAPELVSRIATVQGYPRLRTGFESSVPGLHFLGAPAAWSYGPLLRFVSGTYYASGELTRVACA